MNELHIIPEPKSVSFTGQSLKLKRPVTRKLITALEGAMRHFPKYIERELNAFGIKTRFFEVDNLEEQAYKIEISEKGIVIYACDRTGLKYGFYTLLQVLEYSAKSIPCCTIEDSPAGSFRAFHLDLRVHAYKPGYLKRVFGNLARLKYRYAMLEYEDTFPYHREACITGEQYFSREQLEDMKRAANRCGIEIIPYVSVFSKLDYVLKLELYASLAVEGDPAGNCPEARVLNVTNPRTVRIVNHMIDELKEVHECPYIFIDLGMYDMFGKPSGDAAPQTPEFEEFALSVISRAARKNSVPVIWADLLVNNVELIPALPESTVVVVRETPVRKNREAVLKLCRDYGIRAVNEVACLNTPDAEFSRDTGRMLDSVDQAVKCGPSDGILVTSYSTSGLCCENSPNGVPVSKMNGTRRMHLETIWYAVSAAAEAAWNASGYSAATFAEKWPQFWFDTDDKRLGEIQMLQARPMLSEPDCAEIVRDRKRVIKLSEAVAPVKQANQITMLGLYARLAIHAVHVIKTCARAPKKQQLALLKSEIARMKDKHRATMKDSLYSNEIAAEQKYLFGHTEMLVARIERELK
jgi:hypothetical protein